MAASAAERTPRKSRDLILRVVSALVLAPPVLAALWFGFPWIDLLVALAAPIMVMEWLGMTRGRPLARALGLVYVLCALVGLLFVRHQPDFGRETVIWIVACVWATDIGGYVVGRSLGGAKLAPRISPGKTWAGLTGGMAWAAVASALCGWIFGRGDFWTLALLGAAFGAVGQAGDLFESHAKRRAGIKDSGRIIPGHGGVLDRVDGLMAVIVVVAVARLTLGGTWPWT